MFLSPDEPLPETAGVIVVRALWRYRSELAPVAVAAIIIVAAAATLHRAHPGWWPWLLAATLADTVGRWLSSGECTAKFSSSHERSAVAGTRI